MRSVRPPPRWTDWRVPSDALDHTTRRKGLGLCLTSSVTSEPRLFTASEHRLLACSILLPRTAATGRSLVFLSKFSDFASERLSVAPARKGRMPRSCRSAASAPGRDEPKRSSSWLPQTSHPRRASKGISKRSTKGRLWPRPGLPRGHRKLTSARAGPSIERSATWLGLVLTLSATSGPTRSTPSSWLDIPPNVRFQATTPGRSSARPGQERAPEPPP